MKSIKLLVEKPTSGKSVGKPRPRGRTGRLSALTADLQRRKAELAEGRHQLKIQADWLQSVAGSVLGAS